MNTTCKMCGRVMIPLGTFTLGKAVIAYYCTNCDGVKDRSR